MFVQKQKADIIGKYNNKKIQDRYNNIVNNKESVDYCFRALIESYFELAEYTGVAIKYYCKTGYSFLTNDYGYNDICKFDEYAKKGYEIIQGLRDIIEIKFEKIMSEPAVAAFINSMDERVYRNEFGIPKDFFLREYKKNLFIEVITTYAKISIAQEYDDSYKYDDDDNYHLIMDMYDAYIENSTENLFRDGVRPQMKKEITDLVNLVHKNSMFKGKVFEKK